MSRTAAFLSFPAAILALGLLVASGPASAHAILVQSAPATGATVEAGSVEVNFRYNSRIDRARSRLTLIRADRSSDIVPILDGGGDDVLMAKATLVPGTYKLRWQVLAIDGHITRGDVPFTVRKRAEP